LYALKQIRKEALDHPKRIEHLKQEKQLLMSLQSDWIVKLHQTFLSQQHVCLVFEYLPGMNLFELMPMLTEKVRKNAVVFYSAEVLTALEFLHKRDIIFRDLKPDNVMLCAQGHVKLIDFGFAKQLTERTFTNCGTIGYTAPEVLQQGP
jgi:protein kinase A